MNSNEVNKLCAHLCDLADSLCDPENDNPKNNTSLGLLMAAKEIKSREYALKDTTEWEPYGNYSGMFQCKMCHRISSSNYDYCPHCGRKVIKYDEAYSKRIDWTSG